MHHKTNVSSGSDLGNDLFLRVSPIFLTRHGSFFWGGYLSAARENGPCWVRGFGEIKTLRNEQTKETQARRNHPFTARVRERKPQSGKLLPAEADLGGDAQPLAQEIRYDGGG